eukprot:m.124243 g.124243  ORF g.124243 m.124243 type:complete len:277 (-) comp15699_c0_seq1:1040-1870(-)
MLQCLQRSAMRLPSWISSRTIVTQARRFEGKTAIVTASTDGIGLAIVQRLAEEGCNVILSSRREENVLKAVQELKDLGLDNVSGHVCHVGNADHRTALIQSAIDAHGQLDVLVSNAAVNPVYGPCLDTPEAAWDKIFEINVKAPFLLTQEAMPHLLKTRGNVLYVSSIAGYTPLDGLGPYSVSKTSLLGLTKVLAKECGAQGVRVNGLAPGIIQTKFSSVLYEDDEANYELMRQVPLRRLGSGNDMAACAAFLCSEDAAYVTGETMVAAGGMLSHL